MNYNIIISSYLFYIVKQSRELDLNSQANETSNARMLTIRVRLAKNHQIAQAIRQESARPDQITTNSFENFQLITCYEQTQENS